MDRKAQALSLNTIIVAIIVLIVLVVMIMLFTGYFSTRFVPQMASCDNSGGACQFAKDDGSNGCGYNSFGSAIAKISGTCPGEQVCCSKGLGSGSAPEKDAADCGNENKEPCSIGDACRNGLGVQDGKCVTPCTATEGCVAVNDCQVSVESGYCPGEVCCAALNPAAV